MRWSEERWVKLYTRDEAAWLAVSLGARGLFYELMRKVDGAGLLRVREVRRIDVRLRLLIAHAAFFE